MGKKIIMIFFLSIVSMCGESVKVSGKANIKISSINPLIVTSSQSTLEFGESMIKPWKTLYPKQPILFKIKAGSQKDISIKVNREVPLYSENGGSITFIPTLDGIKGDKEESSDSIVWNTSIEESATILIEFSGSIYLTGEENPGNYEGALKVEVDYN